ncbi:MAG: NUDIX domain-containing protein [Lachnospiraceae bacterium]|nr:NUDIX domain-containing protein [Lachnospiraceae bacterium]
MYEWLRGKGPFFEEAGKVRCSSIMMCLIDTEDGPQVLFEKRSSNVHQPGDISFPGGGRENGETPEENAVRETMEELLVDRSQIDVIACLGTFTRMLNVRLDLFLCELKDYDMTFEPEEVEEVFTVPLEFFLETEPQVYNTVAEVRPEEDFPFGDIVGGRNYRWARSRDKVYFYYYKDRVIWGLTAMAIVRAVPFLKGRGEADEG